MIIRDSSFSLQIGLVGLGKHAEGVDLFLELRVQYFGPYRKLYFIRNFLPFSNLIKII